METPSIDLEDFTCSICREIFQTPVSLACPHTYCQSCIIGLKKHVSSSTSAESSSLAVSSERVGSLSHSSHVHQPHQCFVCAICRQESMGYVRYRQLENQINTLETPCPYCSEVFRLSALRTHFETCLPNSRRIGETARGKSLSQPQTEALQRAQQGENRSTFPCPFCPRTNFSVAHLRQHIKKRHQQENQTRVCPICASMPWGDRTMVISNVYKHIKSRHQFDYDTFVNYDLDEETMMREALKASLVDQ